MHDSLSVAISSGALKGVFAQGVLSAFEGQLRITQYACASSSVISTSIAAMGVSTARGLEYWIGAARNAQLMNMSHVVLESIRQYAEQIIATVLVEPHAPRLLISTSKVVRPEAAAVTQSHQAKKLGRQLLVQALRGDNTWARQNLLNVTFDTQGEVGPLLHADNFREVAYASTRMLHAWEIPASIAGEPFIDASYTCSCPVGALLAIGAKEILVIDPSPGTIFDNIYRTTRIVEESSPNHHILVIQPAIDLVTIGVDFTSASEAGMTVAYQLGLEAGRRFLSEDYNHGSRHH